MLTSSTLTLDGTGSDVVSLVPTVFTRLFYIKIAAVEKVLKWGLQGTKQKASGVVILYIVRSPKEKQVVKLSPVELSRLCSGTILSPLDSKYVKM